MEVRVKRVNWLVLEPKAREWCKLAYPGHPRGCPNYGHSEKCPPKYPFIQEILDINKPIHIIAVSFNLAEHIKRMRQRHPDWTDRQCRCCLYWQGKVNKVLKEKVAEIVAEGKLGNKAEFGPEAAGVNVTLTCAHSGVKLEWPPRKKVHKLALVGFSKI